MTSVDQVLAPRRPASDQRRPVPPRAGRVAGARRRGGDRVPRQQRLAAGRVPRRRGVLRHQRLPDHAAADRRARADGPGAPAPVLVRAGAATAAGAVHDAVAAHGVHGGLPARCPRPAARRRDRRARLRVQLVPDLGRPGVHRVRRLRPAAPPVEPRRGGAVLPAVAAGDDRHPAPRGAAGAERQLGARRRGRGHRRRRRRALPPGSDRHVRADPGGLLAGRRSVHLEDRLPVPVDADAGRRSAARRGAGDGLAAGGPDARADAPARPAARRRRRASGSSPSAR